jgi:hypothetical protein
MLDCDHVQEIADRTSSDQNYEQLLTAANSENYKFRQALWLLNGDVFKYGDDGEMQSLGVDYKRGSADVVIQNTTREIQKTSKELSAANARLEEAEKVIDSTIQSVPLDDADMIEIIELAESYRRRFKYQSQKGERG